MVTIKKKSLTLRIALFVALSVLLNANLTAQSYNKKGLLRHNMFLWSVEARTGLNNYKVAVDQPSTNVSNVDLFVNKISWELPVIRFRCTLNEFTDIGLEIGHYAFNRFRVSGTTNDFAMLASLNLSEYFNLKPNDTFENINVFANLGAGMGSYQYHFNFSPQSGSGSTPLLTGGLNMEINILKRLAFSTEMQYRLYLTNKMSGLPVHGHNQAILFTVGLRYIFTKE
ncbi:MAG: hypothetical protein QM751_10025 [Paludibacteraceae bacterium]